MTPAQTIQLKLSTCRQRLNELLQVETRSAEEQTEMEALTKEVSSKEPELRAALAAEADPQEVVTPTEDAEGRERRELREKVKVSDHLAAAMEGRGLDGAAQEYNQALGLRATGSFPLELLTPAVEERAVTTTDTAVHAGPWLDRLFADTAASRLGITFESVAPGIASYPVITGGGTPAQRGKGQDADDGAWTVGVSELKPTRNAVRAVFSEEDAMRLPGLEEALRRDLAMALTEKVDRTVFEGDSTANPANGDISGLDTLANVVEKEITQANKIKGPETLTAFAELIDGKHSNGLEDLRIVAAVGANSLWLATKISGNNAAIQTMSNFLRDSGLSWTVRGEIEAATTSGKFGAFLGRGRGLQGAGIAAVWNAGNLIRDPYSGGAAGEVALTLSYFWNFGLPRPTNFARIKFVT